MLMFVIFVLLVHLVILLMMIILVIIMKCEPYVFKLVISMVMTTFFAILLK